MKTKYLLLGLIFYLTNCFTVSSQELVNESFVPASEIEPLGVPKNQSLANDTIAISEAYVNEINESVDSLPKNDEKKPARTQVISSKIETSANDSTIFSVDGKKVFLFGEAEINYEGIVLNAAYIEIDMMEGIMYAEGVEDSVGNMIGQPVFVQDGQEMKAKTITYNVKTEKGFIKGLYTEQEDGYLHSNSTKKEPDNSINLHRGKYSTCELEDPHFYLHLSKGKVIPDKAIVAGFSYMVIEGVPLYPLAVPFGFFPTTKEKASGFLIPTFGDEMARGFYLRDGGYYFALNEYADLAITGDVYSKGSWQIGAKSQYKLRYNYSGNIDVAYSNQVVEDSYGDLSESSQYRVVWSHRQDAKARPNSTFGASVNFRSNGDNKYNATNSNERLEQTISSSVSYQKKFANSPFSSSIDLKHNQNLRDSTMTLTIPQMSMTMSRIFPFRKKVAIGKAKWYENIGFSYSGKFDNKTGNFSDSILFTPEVFDEFDYGLVHRIPLSTSVKLFNYLNLSPSMSFTDRMYFKRDVRDYSNYEQDTAYTLKEESGFYNLYDYTYALGFGTKLYGMYQYKNSKVKAIRHVVTPSVSLGYKPDFSDDRFGFYMKDTSETTGYYNPYEFNDIYGMPSAGESGSISMSLNNNLEMKVQSAKDTITGEKKIKLLEALNFSTSYNMMADSLHWSPLLMSARTTLFNIFTINFNATGDFYEVDSSGRRIDAFAFDDSGRLLRLTSMSASTGIRLNSKNLFGKTADGKEGLPEGSSRASYLEYYNYDYFEIPWNVSISYNLAYSKPIVESVVTQKLSVRGDFSLTDKWKIGFQTGWDFDLNQASYTSFNLSRDLHCWVATVSVIPFGQYQSYNFTIGVKSNVLQDLKYNKNNSWLDNSF